jgi:O-antigen ligase
VTLSFDQRRWLVLGLGLLALVSATGLPASHVFHQPSVLKYAVTVAAPLILAALVASEDALALVTSLLVVAAPFAGYAITIHGTHVLLLVPLLILAAYCVALEAPPGGRRSTLAAGGTLMALALVIPLVESPAPAHALSTLISLFAAAYLSSRVSGRERGFRTLVWGFVASAAIQAALALWQRSTGHQLNLYGSAGAQTFTYSGYFFGYLTTTRPPAAFYDPISLGNMLAIAVPLSVGLIVRSVRVRDWTRVALAAGALVVILAGLEATLDRMSWIGALLGLAALTVLLPGGQRRRIVVAIVLAVAAVLLLGGVGSKTTVAQRASSITHPLNEAGTSNGDILRIQIWQRAVAQAAAHPLTGIGLGRFQGVLADELAPAGTQGHAHSTYLQLAAEGGLIAVAGLLAVLIALRRDLQRVRRDDVLWGAVLTGCVLAMLACWLTDVTIRYSGVATYMGILFGMVAGRARLARARAQERERLATALP